MAVNPTGTVYDPTKPPGLVTSGSPTPAPSVYRTAVMPQNPPIGNQTPQTPVSPVAGYQPALGDSGSTAGVGYKATPYSVPKEGLVQERIRQIAEQDSPLMQQAKRFAQEGMVSRGLTNSSIAVGAGQDAVLRSALPIAQQDAGAIANAAMRTSDAQNDARKFGADATNQASNLNAQLVNSMNTTNANALNSALSQTAQAENTRALAVIDNNTKMLLGNLDAQNRQLLQTNANAANMYQETVKNIAGISVNENLTQQAKDEAVRTQINLLREGLATSTQIARTLPAEIEGLNLGSYFNQF